MKKRYRKIKINQNAWLKPYIKTNTDLRKKAKNGSEKDFLKMMNHAAFAKTMKNVIKHRDIKLVTKKKRRDHLASEPNYHTAKLFVENLLAIETKKTKQTNK